MAPGGDRSHMLCRPKLEAPAWAILAIPLQLGRMGALVICLVEDLLLKEW